MFIEVAKRQEALLIGWRWLEDVDPDPVRALDQLYTAAQTFGPLSVAVGDGYEAELALFVHDVCDQELELQEDLLNFECGHGVIRCRP